MKKKMKRIMCALMTAVILSGLSVPAFAQTVNFDITVPGDILSKRATKADNEQKFYVTGTSFNKTGSLYCVSHRRDDSSVYSRTATIRPSKLSANATYYRWADSGVYYYMTTKASVNNLHVKGRYTP